ncbi:hypothetical protein [Bacillus thuringiensis]|uniref:hypothetical protein n=1 Tax=Bacillus thuringiensis TaxID=1428 RepID=UPI0021D68A0A|nr:hypothetical protein [Bacillus thuringiensis]MCU7667551.1 hypothetical protein [Bacillus thuringiensis]
MEMKTLEMMIAKAKERGEKYRISNERLEDAAVKLEKELLEILKTSAFGSNVSLVVEERRYLIHMEKGTVYRQFSRNYSDEFDNEFYEEPVTYERNGRDGTREYRIQFLKDFGELTEKFSAFLEEKEKEIEDVFLRNNKRAI